MFVAYILSYAASVFSSYAQVLPQLVGTGLSLLHDNSLVAGIACAEPHEGARCI